MKRLSGILGVVAALEFLGGVALAEPPDTLVLNGTAVGSEFSSVLQISPTPEAQTEAVCNIADVNVHFYVIHPSDADIDLYLRSPSGTLVELSTDNGSTGDNYINTIFDDEAGMLIQLGVPPFTGSFRPESALSGLGLGAFDGESTNGTWTLEITDDAFNGNTGVLGEWSVEITPSQELTVFYRDNDGDGYGTGETILSCSQPSGWAAQDGDCNDSDSSIHPGASEVCDSGDVDEDCSGEADDNDEGATGETTWYLDADSDNYGVDSNSTSLCNQPNGYVSTGGDCNDENSSINPGAQEVCDGDFESSTDEDCDGQSDSDDSSATGKSTYYEDSDSDNYGDSFSSETVCDQPSGYVIQSGDCNDENANINPGEFEVCDFDNTDEDCNGQSDNLDGSAMGQSTFYADFDMDTYGNPESTTMACDQPTGYVSNSTDCNDSSSSINPGATEVCDFGNVDEDCNGDADNDDEGATGESTFYQDADSDSYGNTSVSQSACDAPNGYVSIGGDCNDESSSIHPGATEVCDVGNTDEDCDGDADDADSSVTGQTTYYQDNDEDGYGNSVSTQSSCESAPNGFVSDSSDCNDNSAQIHPGAQEVCDSENTDEDCDGNADNNDSNATGETTYYLDEDDDGFGDPESTTQACDQPDGYVSDSSDCNDGNSSINPEATEACDGEDVDEDCNGDADDADENATGKTTFYLDEDSDNYGGSTSQTVCDASNGYISQDGDCDDDNSSINPGATEVCDAEDTDEDCDENADDDDSNATGKTTWYLDEDEDGYGNPESTVQACDQPDGYSSEFADCGDGIINTDGVNTEECDDGEGNSDVTPNACRTDCLNAHCGDDVIDSEEDCDNGDENSNSTPNACRTTCEDPACGDNVTDEGETCDDGEANSDTEPDACREDCAVASCGDGVIDDEEDCDDGEDNSNLIADACRLTCADPHCGDGVIDDGEECDDGDMTSEDGCSSTCEEEERFICTGSNSSICLRDTDKDGLTDETECPGLTEETTEPEDCPDADGDDVPDFIDTDGSLGVPGDSDGDGVDDDEECSNGWPCPDTDDDGIPDVLDNDSQSFFDRSSGCSTSPISGSMNATWVMAMLVLFSAALYRRRGSRKI